jgi:hypothetical protein
MKHSLALLLGLGLLPGCKAHEHGPANGTELVTIELSGLR